MQEYWEARKSFFTEKQRADAWDKTAKIVKTYSDEMIDRWNKEIDTLLVYVRPVPHNLGTLLTLRLAQGGLVFGRPDGVQRAVISTPRSVTIP